ncbi:hypothetical protein IEQ34_020192 [Dendrobium chrysotoxum]|uniref:Uncharacterized protein n=1 Tax=Dendrobium chrysotoxum TaxID=161865 RepID=A0AAV7FZU1_DENCH|nr:hypothetical protein IEQ34_020192 [Dendrobium chrysotoxum]
MNEPRTPYGFFLIRTRIASFSYAFSGLAPEIPKNLYHLIKKVVAIRKHLERNCKDNDSKFRLILVESRIHCLACFYKKTMKLTPELGHLTFAYSIETRKLEIAFTLCYSSLFERGTSKLGLLDFAEIPAFFPAIFSFCVLDSSAHHLIGFFITQLFLNLAVTHDPELVAVTEDILTLTPAGCCCFRSDVCALCNMCCFIGSSDSFPVIFISDFQSLISKEVKGWNFKWDWFKVEQFFLESKEEGYEYPNLGFQMDEKSPLKDVLSSLESKCEYEQNEPKNFKNDGEKDFSSFFEILGNF